MLFAICCIPVYATAQDDICIEGSVLEKGSQKAIALASISLGSSSDVTVTNENGVFEFCFLKTYSNDSVIISSPGYDSRKIAVLQWKNGDIFLEIGKAGKKSFNARSMSGQKIMAKLVNNLPGSLAMEPHELSGFFRQTQSDGKEIDLVIEAALQLYDSGYSRSGENVNLLYVTSSDPNGVIRHDEGNALRLLLKSNYMKLRSEAYPIFFDKSIYYHRDSTIYTDGKAIYVTSVGGFPYRSFRFYINAEDFTFIRMTIKEDYMLSPENPPVVWKTDSIQLRTIGYGLTLQFRKYKGKTYLQYLERRHVFQDYDQKRHLEVAKTVNFDQLLINGVIEKGKQTIPVNNLPQQNLMTFKSPAEPVGWKHFNKVR